MLRENIYTDVAKATVTVLEKGGQGGFGQKQSDNYGRPLY